MNHNIFWAKYNAQSLESVKKELMKNYILGLKPSELDSFLLGNIAEIKHSVATVALSKEDKAEISAEVDSIINFIEATRTSKIAA
jgi:hypothetical protein